MIFFERTDDLHVSCPKRKEMLDLLKLRFNCINRNITLRVFGVTNKELIKFMQSNVQSTKRRGQIDLPEDNLRLRE